MMASSVVLSYKTITWSIKSPVFEFGGIVIAWLIPGASNTDKKKKKTVKAVLKEKNEISLDMDSKD